ncbi:MAG: DUF4922 domain-containing protein [Motiliproteus sp.]|nr:DUF4922 domain-containing protein [Motiliproteus sp.]MCW9053125.1 DUF4922 domain-containing protein [Motiliproteus sp.]
MKQQLLEPGQLRNSLAEASQSALTSGALKKVDCTLEHYQEQGISFQLRMLANIGTKQEALKRFKQAGKVKNNPFLPYEQAMYVGDISENRLVLLNKFNVVDHHALIVSKTFEHQQMPLTLEDFQVLVKTMAEFPALGFYNGGKAAGASQSHRHLQLVPLEGLGGDIPISPAVLKNTSSDFLYSSISQLSKISSVRVEQLNDFYLKAIDKHLLQDKGGMLSPYNLLVCHDWAMFVPRSQESYQGISINSLGFAGALLAKDTQQLQLIKQIGCLELLRKVAKTG